MSQSALSRHRSKGIDPRELGQQLGVNAVLVGKINLRPSGIGIAAELVDVETGWQLWGEVFESSTTEFHEVKEVVTERLLAAIGQKLTNVEDKKSTARYTENSEAYQAYLEGRRQWSKFTKAGIEIAISHFRRAIEIDPKYALAYAAITDCYLRLTTNYLPPEDQINDSSETAISERIKLRFEWDWKAAERELHRAVDLKTEYPAAHQWFFAYWTCKQLYEKSLASSEQPDNSQRERSHAELCEGIPAQIASLELTPSEEVQVLCAIVREQIDIGNYEAGRKLLQPWWTLGNRPNLTGLDQSTCADLLLTAGDLAGFLASTVHLRRGQIHAEELVNGAVALYEQLGLSRGVAEGRIALAFCYHRQGVFDMARTTLTEVLDGLLQGSRNRDLRAFTLMRLGCLERHAHRLYDALPALTQAIEVAGSGGPWLTVRCYLELPLTYANLGLSEGNENHAELSRQFYLRALDQCIAVGHHRYAAIGENNIGLLVLYQKCYEESANYVIRSKKSFDALSDTLKEVLPNDTLARLYIETKQYWQAKDVVEQAISILKVADGEVFLAESLTMQGIVYSKLESLMMLTAALRPRIRSTNGAVMTKEPVLFCSSCWRNSGTISSTRKRFILLTNLKSL